MRISWFLLITGFMALSIQGCHSAPKSENPIIEVPTTLERCIGQGQDHYDVIKRCGLRTWAEIPATIEHNKRMAISVGGGSIHNLPCKPNSLWIGTLEAGLVAKCSKNRVRLYWRDFFATSSPIKQPKPSNHIKHSNSISTDFFDVRYYTEMGVIDDSFNVLATVYFGEKSREYRIHGRPFSVSKFGPRPERLEADDRVEKILKEIE